MRGDSSTSARGALAALAFAALMAHPAGAQPKTAVKPVASRPAAIDKNSLMILLRSVILSINQAGETNNYTVLRELGSPAFQASNTSARLSDAFASLRAQHFDLSGVAVLEPQLLEMPSVDAGGRMRVVGFFPSAPIQIRFDFLFAVVNGRYLPEGLSLGLDQPATVSDLAPKAAFPSDSQKAKMQTWATPPQPH